MRLITSEIDFFVLEFIFQDDWRLKLVNLDYWFLVKWPLVKTDD
jgi:hypothetical protein